MSKKNKSKRVKTVEASVNLPVADVPLMSPIEVLSDDNVSPQKLIIDEQRQQNEVFLENDANAGNDAETVTKKKKKKKNKKRKSSQVTDEETQEIKDERQRQEEEEANKVEETVPFALGHNCYAQISSFSGTAKLDIRMYTKKKLTGEMKPKTTRGIAITIEQWNALKSRIEDIDQAFVSHRSIDL